MTPIQRLLLGLAAATILPGTASAEGFDGLRVGIEGTWSSHTVRVDAGKPQRDGLEQYQRGIDAGNRSLASARELRERTVSTLNEQSARLAAARTELAEAERLRDAILSTPVPVPGPGGPVASTPLYDLGPLNQRIEQGRAAIAAGSDLLARGQQNLSNLDGAIARGETNLARTQGDMNALQVTPAVSSGTGTGGGVRLSAGYGRSIGRLYLGVEADATQESHDLTVRPLNRTSVHIGFGTLVGAQARVGYQVIPGVLPFVSLGGETGEWKVTRNNGRTSTDWRPQGRAGAGIEFLVTDSTIFRISYERSFGGEFRLSGAVATAHRDTFKVGLVRTF